MSAINIYNILDVLCNLMNLKVQGWINYSPYSGEDYNIAGETMHAGILSI